MSKQNSLENKKIRREEREARKRSFKPTTTSFEVPETKQVIDEDGTEVTEIVKTNTRNWFHLPGRSDRRGNKTKARRGKGI